MLSVFWFIVTIATAVSIMLALSPIGRKLLRSVQSFAAGGINDVADVIGGSSPLSQAKAQIEAAVDKGRQASRVVEKAAASIETIKYNLDSDMSELHRLENRLKTAMAEGDPNGTASGYALRIADLEKAVDMNRESLTEANDLYERNVTLVRRFQEDVSAARRDISSLGQQLEQSSAEKDLYSLASSLRSNLSTDAIAEAKRKVQDQINVNRGSCRAARDMNASHEAEMLDDKADRKSRADEVMARYAVK